jgi:hypothetical protein
MSTRFKEQFKRIEQILSPQFSNISKRLETLEHYKKYLERELKFPIGVTGWEDFSWEEFYVLGPGDKREYEALKRTRASYTDILQMTRLSAHCDPDYGLFAHLTRKLDKKRFELPLADFKAVNKKSVEYQLLEDYSVWIVNN